MRAKEPVITNQDNQTVQPKKPRFTPVGWFLSLIGKGYNPNVNAESQQTVLGIAQAKKVQEEDAVLEDIKKLKGALGELQKRVDKKIEPSLEKGEAGTKNLVAGAKSTFDPEFVRKIIRTLVVGLLVIVVVLILVKAVQTIRNNNNGKNNQSAVTPTPPNYQPYQPSIYANDSDIKKMDVDSSILEKELSNINLRDDSLNPPTLDFNVNFQ